MLAAAPQGAAGFRGEYFNDTQMTLLVTTRIDRTINFDWGESRPAPRVAKDNFAVRWTGWIVTLTSETYTFKTDTDDGLRLWVNEQNVIDHWGGGGQHTGAIALKARTRIPLRMEMRDTGGHARAKLYWSSGSVREQIIPSRYCIPNPKSTMAPRKPVRRGAKVPKTPAIDEAKVDRAIDKGIKWLRTARNHVHGAGGDTKELMLLTMLHAGLTPADPRFKELLAEVLADPLKTTYNVSILAMVLEGLNRVEYQPVIWKCAQFLVDNQCRNGQWSYGQPTTYGSLPRGTPTGGRRPVSSRSSGILDFGSPKSTVNGKPVRRIPVKKQRKERGAGTTPTRSTRPWACGPVTMRGSSYLLR